MQVKLLKNHREFTTNEIAIVTDIRGRAMIDQEIAVLDQGKSVKRKAERAILAEHRERRSIKKRKNK